MLKRDGGRWIGRAMASGWGVDWILRARDWRDRGGECDASRLLGAGVAEAETRSAQVLGTSVDRSRGCWRGAQVCKVWEAETIAPRLMAAVVFLGGSWIGRELRSASMNCLTPCFDPQNVEERLRRCLSE